MDAHLDDRAPGRVAYRTCPLCEAGCGLAITLRTEHDGTESVVRIRGDRDDVFSGGYICPKGSTLKQLHDDPDRLRQPLVKRGGVHVAVSWAEAWAEVERGLTDVIDRHGRDAVAVYFGNPSAHNLSTITFNRALLTGLGTRQRYSASTVDQMPKHVAAGLVFGTPMSVPVPDLDRTDLLVVFGANPMVSNGSLCTAPDFPARLRRLRARGGRLVVVDPRCTATAKEADEWLAIRPGTDALALMAIVNVLFVDGLADPGSQVAPLLAGVDDLRAVSAPFTPEVVSPVTGIAAGALRRLAHALAESPSAAVYGRIGTTTTEFGAVASWLIDAVNVLTGNLDRPGGAMFSRPVAGGPTTRGEPGHGSGFRPGRHRTRVRGLPDVMGEFPVAALAEEITTGGEGQVRALVAVAGNPVLSTPNSDAVDAALDDLEFMVSVDIYLNETTRHADVILPAPSPLQRSHFDVLLLQFAVRNVANYSPPVLPLDAGQPDEWEILAKLALIAQGLGAAGDPAIVDDLAVASLVRAAVADPSSPVHGMDADELVTELAASGRQGPDRLLDAMVRTGPYGDGFGSRPGGATLDLLIDNPHGVDYGPLEPRLPEILRTPSGKVELAPPELIADVERLWAVLDQPLPDTLLLVGRRDVRSNNSWMHNLEVLVKGRPRCTLQIHPDDADRLGLRDGSSATVRSRVGSVVAPVEVTDGIRPGVVSLPHGWGHGREGTRLRVAAERRGVNSNVLTDHRTLDPLSGTSVLNGISVTVAAVNGG